MGKGDLPIELSCCTSLSGATSISKYRRVSVIVSIISYKFWCIGKCLCFSRCLFTVLNPARLLLLCGYISLMHLHTLRLPVNKHSYRNFPVTHLDVSLLQHIRALSTHHNLTQAMAATRSTTGNSKPRAANFSSTSAAKPVKKTAKAKASGTAAAATKKSTTGAAAKANTSKPRTKKIAADKVTKTKAAAKPKSPATTKTEAAAPKTKTTAPAVKAAPAKKPTVNVSLCPRLRTGGVKIGASDLRKRCSESWRDARKRRPRCTGCRTTY